MVVRAATDGTEVQAQRITIAPVLIGPVQMANGNLLRALGQRVRLTANTRLAGFGENRIAAGDRVAVYGLRAPDGSVIATRVARRDPAGTVHLQGPIGIEPDGTASIYGQRLRLPRGTGPTAAAGTTHVVTGQLRADSVVDVRTSRPAPAALLIRTLPSGGRMVLEGYVQATAAGMLRLSGLDLAVSSATVRVGPLPSPGHYARATVAWDGAALAVGLLEPDPASAWPGIQAGPLLLEVPDDPSGQQPAPEDPGALLERSRPLLSPDAANGGHVPLPFPLPLPDRLPVLRRP